MFTVAVSSYASTHSDGQMAGPGEALEKLM